MRIRALREASVTAVRAMGFLLLAFWTMSGIEAAVPPNCRGKVEFTEDFRRGDCTFVNQGRTTFWVLEPNYWLKLEGMDGREFLEVTVTVLPDTEMVDGVNTRVVEERELVDGELVEVSRNFFAICQETSSVFYFGEDVDIYENGEIVSHDGAWRAGVAGATPGIIMPGTFLLGSRYFNEIAPDVAMDRACNSEMNVTQETPAGTFQGCVSVYETTPLEKKSKSLKDYCPGIGVVRDDEAVLVDWSESP